MHAGQSLGLVKLIDFGDVTDGGMQNCDADVLNCNAGVLSCDSGVVLDYYSGSTVEKASRTSESKICVKPLGLHLPCVRSS